MRRLAEERSKWFDQEAECYDRCRPTYPAAVIDELLGREPAGLDVLDVGCGTGIASRQMAERGARGPTAKAASLLRPGGRLCLIWSAGCHPDDLADALAEVYARLFPTVGNAGFGYAASRPTDRRTGLTSVVEAIAAVPEFATATENWFPWAREYDRNQWLDLLQSRSDHVALDSAVRERLFEAIGAAIDDHGGSFVMSFETGLITATRLA